MGEDSIETDDPLIIVGNGMVSWRLCQQLVKQGVHHQRKIQVFGDERTPAYDRVNLTSVFKGKGFEDLILSDEKWYKDHGIELKLGERVQKLDAKKKNITDSSGKIYPYSDCVLATGSRSFIPPIKGIHYPNVFAYRTVEDVRAIISNSKEGQRCIVIGGGLLGLEAAEAVKERELSVVLVQLANALLSRQLNQEGASYVQRHVESLGIEVRLSAQTTEIEADSNSLKLWLSSGDCLEADMIIVAAGISANDKLAVEADIHVGARGGIVIDDELRTSDPNVYAIGECASHKNTVYGLVAPGYRMADILAARFSGENKSFSGSDLSCRLKLLGIDVSVFGDFLEDGDEYIYKDKHVYRSLITHHRKVVGATIVGPCDQALVIERAVTEQAPFSEKQYADFVNTGRLVDDSIGDSVLSWPDHALVCHCTNTNCGKLRKLVLNGCNEVSDITEETGAGGVCGSCLPSLAEFVGKDAKEIAAMQNPVKGRFLLLLSALVAFVFCLGYALVPAFPASDTVQTFYYKFTQLWQDPFIKRVTGFTMLGLSVIAILLSLRKRVKKVSFGNYGFWRAVHSILGVSTILILLLHTGLSFGENLNLWLMICFVGLNFAGALAGIAIACEKKMSPVKGMRFRKFATKLHIILFIPYPVLVGFHIAKAFLY